MTRILNPIPGLNQIALFGVPFESWLFHPPKIRRDLQFSGTNQPADVWHAKLTNISLTTAVWVLLRVASPNFA